MTVILVTQEIGSRGDEVAAGIAACLGFELVQGEGIEQCLAERMQISKCTVHRLLEGNASLVERWMVDPRRLLRCMKAEVVKLAARGNIVVRSWGAAALLRPIRHVICVHVYAPARAQLLPPAAKSGAMVPCRRLQRRGAKMSRWLSGEREALEHYDLVLNTERIPLDECVEQVRRLAQGPQFQPTAASRAMLASLGQEACNDALLISDSGAERAAQALEVDVGSDTIRLSPTMSSEEAIARVEQHLRGTKARAALAAHGSGLQLFIGTMP